VPLTPLPTGYTALVNCNHQGPTNVTVTFGPGGGIGTTTPSDALDNIAIGTVCTVVEQGTSGFDPATVVTYTPTGADTTGVTIPDSQTGVTVQISNDFSAAPVQVSPETVTEPPAAQPAAQAVAVQPVFTG
jgi:hypothetical protein